MFFSENNRLSKPHFDWPLLVTSYLLALYGVLAITIANFNPSLGSDRSLQDLIMDANNGRLQLMWVVVSMVVVAIIMSINYNIIGRLWPVIYFVDVLLLGLVLTTSKINGVSGWFHGQRRQALDRGRGHPLPALRAGQIGADYHPFKGADALSGQTHPEFPILCLYLYAFRHSGAPDRRAAGHWYADGFLYHLHRASVCLGL